MSGNDPFTLSPVALHDFADCRALDAASIAAGFSEQQLMGQAALASSLALLPQLRKNNGRLLILCGGGNNGGDGYALAFMLLGALADTQSRIGIYAASPPKTAPARFYRELIEQHGLEVCSFAKLPDEHPHSEDLIVEALLGIGQVDAPRGEMAGALQWLRSVRAGQTPPRLIALDVPIGLTEAAPTRFSLPRQSCGADSFPLPDEIHCYGVEKIALRTNAQIAAFSHIRVLPIGFLPSRDARQPSEPRGTETKKGRHAARFFLSREVPLTSSDIQRRALDHKYSAGHARIAGGSAGMEGALLLAARAFMAAGGGIVHCHTRSGSEKTWRSYPAAMFGPLEAWSWNENTVSVVGPGLSGQDRDALISLLEQQATETKMNEKEGNQQEASPNRALCILDAGALELATHELLLTKKQVLITPHSGEWKRLGGPNIECPNDLQKAAHWNADTLGCWTLLKGPVSFLFPPQLSHTGAPDIQAAAALRSEEQLNPDGVLVFCAPNPNLATAGSGDILTGILAAVAARRRPAQLSVPQTVTAALQLHGLIGRGPNNMDAVDLIENLKLLSADEGRSGGRPA